MCRHEIINQVQEFLGSLSKSRVRNLRMRKDFNLKSSPKVCACTDSHRDFGATNLKISVTRLFRLVQVWSIFFPTPQIPPAKFLYTALVMTQSLTVLNTHVPMPG